MEDKFVEFMNRNNIDEKTKCLWGMSALQSAMNKSNNPNNDRFIVHDTISKLLPDYFEKELEGRTPEQQRIILGFLNGLISNFTPLLDMDMSVSGKKINTNFRKNASLDLDYLYDGLVEKPKVESLNGVEKTFKKMKPMDNDILNEEKQKIIESKHLDEETKKQMLTELEENSGMKL